MNGDDAIIDPCSNSWYQGVAVAQDNFQPEKLKIAREAQGLSQRQLGAILGVAHVQIGRWERAMRHPNIEHQKRISAWLEEAMQQPSAGEATQARPELPIIEPPPRKAPRKLTPALRERIIEELKAGKTHREIKNDLGVGLATISRIRREEGIPTKSFETEKAEYIYRLWGEARQHTRLFDPSNLSHADKISFGMGLLDIMMWLRRYIESNLADVTNAQNLTEEVKKSFWNKER